MSDIGRISGKLNRASRLLQPYIVALGDAKLRGGATERQDEVQSLLDVLAPMSLHLRDSSYFDLGINWDEVSGFLRRQHREDWPAARDGIVALASMLEKDGGPRVSLSGEEMSVLGGVARALDSECSRLFWKMRTR